MNSKLQLILTSSNKESLVLYKIVLTKIFAKLNIQFKYFDLPTTKKRITLNKSPHVNKTAREQFELRNYKVVFQVFRTVDNLALKYVFLNKPKTIKIKIKKLT